MPRPYVAGLDNVSGVRAPQVKFPRRKVSIVRRAATGWPAVIRYACPARAEYPPLQPIALRQTPWTLHKCPEDVIDCGDIAMRGRGGRGEAAGTGTGYDAAARNQCPGSLPKQYLNGGLCIQRLTRLHLLRLISLRWASENTASFALVEKLEEGKEETV